MLTKPRPEHPMPQMKREAWENLNGEWEFEMDFGVSGREREVFKKERLEGSITVPFCPESSLSGIGYTDFIPAVWYSRTIEVAEQHLAGRVLLHFGAVDYEAILYVNGVEAGSHKGGFASFFFDIRDFLKKGENRLTLYAMDDVRSPMQARGKQCEKFASYACDYTRTTGIWQTVWLEYLPDSYIEKVKYYPDIHQGSVLICAQVKGRGTFRAEAFWKGQPCGSTEAETKGGTVSIILKLAESHLWQVGKGGLYDLQLSLGQDKVSSYFGLREVRMEGYKFLLNGESVFQRLVLDQGFYPDGIYTAPTEEAFVKDIEISMEAGFNGARLHQKIFEPGFLYHCDRLGYLVWGEYGNWGLDYSAAQAMENFLPEWMEAVERDFNHPAIIGWCPFNETWDYEGRKQRDALLSVTYHATKLLDATRPCIDTSGNFHVITDIYDVHNYQQDVEKFRAYYDPFREEGGTFKDDHQDRQSYGGNLPVFVSEYGGIKWAPKEERKDAWGYGEGPATLEAFMERYEGLTAALLENPKICGFCYTQLYDVEQEQNGLYFYDRSAKFDMELIRKINSGKAAIED